MSRDALEQNQIPIYFVAVIAAAIGGLIATAAAQSLNALVTPTIAVLMYAMFLQIPFLDFRESLSNKRFMSALLIANFVLIPLLVWALTRGLAEHPAVLIGALLVLLTPCIDYVVVFTHIGRGDSRAILAATPILLLLQLVLLPVYLAFMLGEQSRVVISIAPFAEAFLALIVVPLLLAVATAALAKRSRFVGRWNTVWAWMPVPAMAAVLIAVVGSQISPVVRDIDQLLPVIPVYIADSTPSGHPVRSHLARHSTAIWPPVPRPSGRAVGAQRRRGGIVSPSWLASSISASVCALIHPSD